MRPNNKSEASQHAASFLFITFEKCRDVREGKDFWHREKVYYYYSYQLYVLKLALVEFMFF